MKKCLVCGLEVAEVPLHCPKCGEASWEPSFAEADVQTDGEGDRDGDQ